MKRAFETAECEAVRNSVFFWCRDTKSTRNKQTLYLLAADCQLRSADSRTCVVRQTYCTATLGTDVSRLPVQGCGTAFQLVLGKQTSAMNSSSGC